MPDISNFIRRLAKIANAAPGTPGNFRQSQRSAYKIAKCVTGFNNRGGFFTMITQGSLLGLHYWNCVHLVQWKGYYAFAFSFYLFKTVIYMYTELTQFKKIPYQVKQKLKGLLQDGHKLYFWHFFFLQNQSNSFLRADFLQMLFWDCFC